MTYTTKPRQRKKYVPCRYSYVIIFEDGLVTYTIENKYRVFANEKVLMRFSGRLIPKGFTGWDMDKQKFVCITYKIRTPKFRFRFGWRKAAYGTFV